MEYKIADHIRTKASLAVLVIDDYTNRIITDTSIQVSIENAGKPVHKSEGYYVFLNLLQSKVELTIQGSHYSTEKRSIDISGINRTEPITKIRVKPNRNYFLQNGTTCLAGTVEPFSEVRVFCDHRQKYYRLLYDYDPKEKREEISIFNPEKVDLDGKVFQIKDKDEVQSEIFYIVNTKDIENNSYLLQEPLKASYKKVGTRIYPVFITKADEKGEFFIPLINLEEEVIECQCEILGKKIKKQTLHLEAGKVNTLQEQT